MSTTNVVRGQLSAEQTAKCRSAIHSYLKECKRVYGQQVFLLPEFTENADGTWSPVQGNGMRLGSKGTAFMRLGKVVVSIGGNGMKESYLFTNVFGSEGQSAEELCNALLALDANAAVGKPISSVRLVVHESLVPFSRVNPARDIKTTPEGTPCVKYIPDDQGVVKEMPIYRVTKAFTCDEAGTYPPQATNQLIQHDNAQALSDAAYARWQQNNKANSGMGNTAQKAARIAELKAIQKAKRTPEQVAELAELLED